MDAIEKAIRSAFAKGDAQDRAYREKVYRSAFGALERAIGANPGVDGEAARQRRQQLSAQISRIETEFIPAIEVPAARASAPSSPAGREAVELVEQELRARRDAQTPRTEDSDAPAEGFSPRIEAGERRHHAAGEKRGRRGRDAVEEKGGKRRRGLLLVISIAAVVAVLAFGALWLGGPAPVGTAADGGGATPPAAGLTVAGDDWIVVFSPSDPTLLRAPAGTSADVMEDDGEAFVRLRSGADGAMVGFEVGTGVLERLAGRRAVFGIVAQAVEEEPTQISVDCDFGALGGCGRKRYLVGPTREEFLFEVDLPDRAPAGAGVVTVNSDIENGGRSVDVFEIRVSPAS